MFAFSLFFFFFVRLAKVSRGMEAAYRESNFFIAGVSVLAILHCHVNGYDVLTDKRWL